MRNCCVSTFRRDVVGLSPHPLGGWSIVCPVCSRHAASCSLTKAGTCTLARLVTHLQKGSDEHKNQVLESGAFYPVVFQAC